MTTELNKISDTTQELIIIVTKDEFTEVKNEILKKTQSRIKMPGFRPGKVPTNIIIGQYGPSIKLEAQEELANKSFREYVEKNNVQILGSPALVDIIENEDDTQTYKIQFEVLPEIILKDYKSIEIYEPSHKVTDKEIDDELDYQAKALGKKEDADIVSDYDMIVTVDSFSIDYDTKELLEAEPLKDIPIDLSQNTEDDFKQKLLNAKVGDEIFNLPPTENKDKFRPEKIVVKKIERSIPAILDAEFAKQASNNKFDNIEDYKQEIGFALQKEWDDRTHNLMIDQLMSKVIEMHEDFELPTQLVEQGKKIVLDNLKQQNPNMNFDSADMEIDKYISKSAESLVRTQLVRDKIIEVEGLVVEDFDYENFLDEFYNSHPEFTEYAAKDMMLTQIKADENLKIQLLQKKLTDLLLDFSTTNEIDYDEYTKMRMAHHHEHEHEHEHNENCNAEHEHNCE